MLVDAVAVAALPESGAARYCQALSPRLMAARSLDVLVLDRGGLSDLAAVPAATRIPFPMVQSSWSGPVDSALIQRVCDHYDIDVVLGSLWTTPLKTPLISIVQDMVAQLRDLAPMHPCDVEKDLALTYAARLLCPSEQTRDDVVSFYPERPPETVRVGHAGREEGRFEPVSQNRVEAFRQTQGLGDDYVLCLGAPCVPDPRESLATTLAAIGQIDFGPLDILCIGQVPEALREEAGVRVTFLDPGPGLDLAAAYSGAMALSFPVARAGAGLPVLDAMARGCPVITTTAGASDEIVKEAVEMVPADDPGALTAALSRLASEPCHRKGLIHRGKAWVREQDWHQTVEILIDMIHETATDPHDPEFHDEWTRLRTLQSRFL
ncbi:glycosyltransferase [Aliiroseovarius sp.]|uniref:glycosyltransferase n=1 Tax=Aliiroseovarius sp. TaxID=1872442 RepID=UPI00262069F7|nr:glycosyltransferase [Aliiroseovarius sp.]